MGTGHMLPFGWSAPGARGDVFVPRRQDLKAAKPFWGALRFAPATRNRPHHQKANKGQGTEVKTRPNPAREARMAEAAPSTSRPRWGFIGAGKMATALVRGMLRAGTATSETVTASDPFDAARAALRDDTGVLVTDSNLKVV